MSPHSVASAASPLRHRLAAVLDSPAGPGSLTDLLRGAPRRMPVPRVTDRAAWEAVDPASSRALLAAAAAELPRPAPVLRASDWARTFRDGVRTVYEDQARALRSRVALFVLAALLTGEDAPADAPPGTAPHLDAAADALMAFAEAGTWCWAPHDRFTAGRGEVVPDPDEPFLDLGAAEVALLFAWADHVLGPRLDTRAPGVRRRLRREMRLRVFEPFLRIRDWHWIGLDGDAHNWNAWIHSAVLTSALLLADDPDERATLVRLVIEGLDRYVAVLPDDGGIDEGVSYWWQGAGRLLESLDLLAAVGGTALDARDLPVLTQLVRYPHRTHLNGPWYVNVGDAPARLPAEEPWHLLHSWGRLLDDRAVREHALFRGRSRGVTASHQDGLGRAVTGLTDPVWRAAVTGRRPTESSASSWLARDVWLPRVQLLVAREESGGASGLTVAVKGGHNAERHNHLDVGSYWVALDGKPVVVDIGKPTYTAASFGPDRYQAWPLRSGWHNVPDPGAEQLPGVEHRADGVRADLTDVAAEWSADLAAAYPDGLLDRWRRTVRLVRATAAEDAYVLVEDEPGSGPAVVRLRHVLAGDVELSEGQALVEAGTDRVLRLSWDPARLTGQVEHQSVDDPALRKSWGSRLTRLTLRADPPVTRSESRCVLRVRIERAT
ncbi:heparinase [Actinacidiphila alni]|uniref:heparinase n=1 Tax=Actinacidiphila alni TaxID=380248 RepID=UPI0033DA1D18